MSKNNLEGGNCTKPFKLVGLGGSFDHLHDGHRLLLRTAVKLSQFVAIGLTTDVLLKHKKFYERIQSYETREQNVRNFLENELKLSSNSYVITPIKDKKGSAATNRYIDALISSEETHENAIEINKKRVENGLKPLVIIVIPLTLDSAGNKLSSTSIRSKLKEGGDMKNERV